MFIHLKNTMLQMLILFSLNSKQMQLDDMLKRCEHFLKDQYAMTAMNGMGHVEKLLKYFPEEK